MDWPTSDPRLFCSSWLSKPMGCLRLVSDSPSMWYKSSAVWTGGMSPCRPQGVRVWGLRAGGKAVHGCTTQNADAIPVMASAGHSTELDAVLLKVG
jgi:hypothetical protein